MKVKVTYTNTAYADDYYEVTEDPMNRMVLPDGPYINPFTYLNLKGGGSVGIRTEIIKTIETWES